MNRAIARIFRPTLIALAAGVLALASCQPDPADDVPAGPNSSESSPATSGSDQSESNISYAQAPSCANGSIVCSGNQVCDISSATCKSCPAGQRGCLGNVCRQCCDSTDCSNGRVCSNGTCVAKPSCSNGQVQCAANQICNIASASCVNCPAGLRGCLGNVCCK
jgi:hypothetical protein